MNVRRFAATSFRNLNAVDMEFGDGVNIFYGRNGSGKTNLLEAIMVLLLGRSQRGAPDGILVQTNADHYRLVGSVVNDRQKHELAIAFQRGGRKRVTLDDMVIRTAELYDHFTAVAAGPEDTFLLGGPPAGRRQFMDLYLSQFSRSYLADLVDYQRCLSQKNAALKNQYDSTPFDDVLAPLAARIIVARRTFLRRIAEDACKHHALVAGGEELSVVYKPSMELPDDETVAAVEERYRETLLVNRDRERYLGVAVFGPHRDDIEVHIANLPARSHGSQGQLRTAAVSMKLAVYTLLRGKTSRPPVLLLDEIFAELDERRSLGLIEAFGEFDQLFLTTAARPPEALMDRATSFRIADGALTEEA